ncbi:hypothetical protein EPA93_14980 [Ktedonosporobacter rubrisoli]|uniref:Transposase IS66 central domain-containing protein n=1 Tax=Ktedonosporobacter rubrisoli TaxID=2509675 RepID=A0A4P6JPC6_KTERU|nr:hypothetical protein EPA93_14980 [Ktedonosporobacter rubrisoli]
MGPCLLHQAAHHYEVHRCREREGLEAIGIAPAFRGTSVHDGLGSYQSYNFTQALCNVHHLRELTFIEEECKQPWAKQMKDDCCQDQGFSDCVMTFHVIGRVGFGIARTQCAIALRMEFTMLLKMPRMARIRVPAIPSRMALSTGVPDMMVGTIRS